MPDSYLDRGFRGFFIRLAFWIIEGTLWKLGYEFFELKTVEFQCFNSILSECISIQCIVINKARTQVQRKLGYVH